MKGSRLIAAVCGLLAVLCAAGAIGVAALCRDTDPVLLDPPEEAVQQVVALMDAICDGNFSEAQTLLYGSWDLGASREPADQVGRLLWEAYVDSLDYELSGELYATETGIAQDVKLIYLELPALTQKLGSRSRALLQETMDSAEDVSQLYDESNGYREDLVMGILQEAACQAVEEDRRYTYQVIPLHLIFQKDRWWVVADRRLLDILGMAGQGENG